MAEQPIRVRALAMGFFGNLRDKGDEFLVADEAAFAPSWMERLDADAPAAPAAQGDIRYMAEHNGGGNWIVVKIEDGSRASRRFLKSEGNARRLAEDEAIRLNAGGELILEALPTTPAAPADPDSATDPNLPDA